MKISASIFVASMIHALLPRHRHSYSIKGVKKKRRGVPKRIWASQMTG